MNVVITPGVLRGAVSPPPSKSITHRALICSVLAQGVSVVENPLISEDTRATRRVLEGLGIEIYGDDNRWTVEGEGLVEPALALHCGESGTTMRLMTAVCALVNGECNLTGGPSLSNRPMGPLTSGLRQLGVDCEDSNGFPPVTVRSDGNIEGGASSMRGDVSSQFVSALLIVAPYTRDGVRLELTTPLESKPYVSMTMDVQRAFGVEVDSSREMTEFKVRKQEYVPANLNVEGDWSSASFLLAAGALSGDVEVRNLSVGSRQADEAIVEVLASMGVDLQRKEGSLRARTSELRGTEVDLSNSPDLFPIVAAACASASGISVLRGLRRLQYKESDRVSTMVEGLTAMGVDVERDEKSVTIHGGKPRGAVIDSHNDHRIAMTFAVLGIMAEGETVIRDAGCVEKSYPGFWDDLEALGASIRRKGT